MKKIALSNEDLALAYELAKLYYQMDNEGRLVSNSDIERLYGAAAKNPNIHYKALEINRIKYRRYKAANEVR